MKYEQLSDKAKHNARRSMYDINVDHDWWDGVYEYVGEAAKSLGFEWFEMEGFDLDRGSYVQYDGQFSTALMKLDELSDKQRDGLKWFIEPIIKQAALCAIHTQGSYLYAVITPTGRVSLNVDWEVCDVENPDELEELLDGEAIETAFSAFADWIQARLQEDYDYLTSDEAIEETIIANEYDFDEEGKQI
jgi:hypothetical protein